MKASKWVLYILMAIFTVSLVSAASQLVETALSPSPAVSGGILTVEYTLINVHGPSEVETSIVMPDAIRHTDISRGGGVYQFSETFRLPNLQPGLYPVFLKIHVSGEKPHYDEYVLEVVDKNNVVVVPSTSPEHSSNKGEVEVEITAGREILQGAAAYYPITVTNNNNHDVDVTISAEGVESWATYRIDPKPTITVPARGTAEAFMFLAVDEDCELGITTFDLKVSHAYDEVIPVSIAVLAPEKEKEGSMIHILILAIILIAIALVVATLWQRKSGGDDDQITYY